jgi:predicted RNA-binding Zn-ribbon protein involved in translation (DUF1610 family)
MTAPNFPNLEICNHGIIKKVCAACHEVEQALGAARLLGCPLCGGEATIERKGSARASMIIACTNCGGRMESGDVYGLTKPESWAWNRRHPNAPGERPADSAHPTTPKTL